MGPMPERPSMSPCHVGSLPMPRGETIPIPVTTTRRLVIEILEFATAVVAGTARTHPAIGTGRMGPVPDGSLRSFGALVDVFDGVPDLLDLLGLIIGYLDAELLFERHDQLDRVERVRSEVFDE